MLEGRLEVLGMGHVNTATAMNNLALTLGVDTWPPALKTPFGRFGAPE